MSSERAIAIAERLSVLGVAVVLVPAGAHLAELPRKMQLSAAEYMTVQQIYSGWSLFGFVIAAALLCTAWHAWVRRGTRSFAAALLGFLLLAASHGIFWTFTYPVNVATENWTRMPVDFATARFTWECSHAAAALLVLLALIALVTARDPGPLRSGHAASE
jgi:hypothetical protein